MKSHFSRVAIVICIGLLASTCRPTLIDISPDRANGVAFGGSSTAGLMINMAGDKDALYSIGLNSGVWKTEVDKNGSFNKWKQLSKSPRYAHCIAIDPLNSNHIVVGERKSDAITDNNCGLWESFDGGNTFQRKSVVEVTPCNNNIVNAVVITNKSTILTSTPVGIGRKAVGETSFAFPASTVNKSFTSIATFKDLIVARTRTAIFISSDDGVSWEEFAIQFNFPGQNFANGEREGLYSICVMQVPQTNSVFVYVPATRTPNGPCIAPDKGIDPCTGKQSNPQLCNYSSFLVFNKQNSQWNFQIIRDRGLGTGLGGRAFMKSFFSGNANLQDKIGGNTNLIYCSAQNIFKATSINQDGTAVWENIANADICGETKPSGFHADIWDFQIDRMGHYAWVSNDGGVYYVKMDDRQTAINLTIQQKYLNLNAGLHTQHIHGAFVASVQGTNPIEEHYGYGTQDNGAWKNRSMNIGSPSWSPISNTTDVNIIEGDQGNPLYIVTARHLQSAVLEALGPTPIGVKPGATTIMYGNSKSFQFIQTLSTEKVNGLLDAVVLTTLPVKYVKDPAQFAIDGILTNVPGPLGSGSGAAILRNSTFAANPDINLSAGVGWNIEFNDLPANPQAFWVSGGHADPTYFLLCEQTSKPILYKRKKSEATWLPAVGLDNVEIVPFINGQVQHGPVFVNPYDPAEIYVSCKDGIYHYGTAVGGLIFQKDVELTNLVSGNGKYALDRIFRGGDILNVVWANQSVLNSMYPLSWIAFNRFNPKQMVASSPFTGVFYKEGTKKWRDFSDLLPKPYTPISSVNINNQGIYITTEGRGMFMIRNY